jgi:hypothetical protein
MSEATNNRTYDIFFKIAGDFNIMGKPINLAIVGLGRWGELFV